jgi:transposase
MDLSKLLLNALGLQYEDVKIEAYELDQQNLTVCVKIRQIRESCRCPKCHEPLYGVKQWRRRELWGIPLGALQRVKIIFYQLQAACGRCLKLPLAEARFIHPRFKQMTVGFSEHVGRWMEETTIAAVQRMTGCPGMSLWRLDQWRMKMMKKMFEIPTDMPMKFASADEVHMRTIKPKDARFDKSKWDKKFITNLVSCDLAKVVANASGRSSRSLANCLKQIPEHIRNNIKFIAVDMHDGYINSATKLCPNAKVTVDRFHVAEALNRAFDELRKQEFDKAKQANDAFQSEMLKPSKKYILVARKKELSKKDQSQFERLIQVNKNISNGLVLIDYFHNILDKHEVKDFRDGLKLWEELVKASKIIQFEKFLVTVRKHQSRIEAYISSKLTTAISEGINNKIKVLKRVGYTYTNEESFKNKILQRCGFINSQNLNTNEWYWHIPTPH